MRREPNTARAGPQPARPGRCGSAFLTALLIVAHPAAAAPVCGSTSPVLIDTRTGTERTRTPHSQTLETVSTWQTADGVRTTRTNLVTVLATGLFYESQGRLLPSTEEFQLSPTAALARHGPHQVALPLEIGGSNDVPFSLDTDHGQHFRWRVRGLGYHDLESGRSVWIAQTRPARAHPSAPNCIVYRNAFDDIEADLQFEYAKASFAQDVVLRTRLPSPVCWGLNPDRVRLEIVTEFLAAPEPAIERLAVRAEPDPARGARMAEPVLTHDRLVFGRYAFGPGVIYWANANPIAPADNSLLQPPPVLHRWEPVDGHPCLFEQIEWAALEPLLQRLPPPATTTPRPRTSTPHGAPPTPPPLSAPQFSLQPPDSQPTTALASADGARIDTPASSSPALVLDWTLVNSGLKNFTFQSDTTYLIAGTVNLDGSATLEGGAVLKYTNNGLARLNINGSLVCATAPYRPAIFTGNADDTVGDPVPHGPPSDYYAAVALQMPPTGGTVSHLRINRARTAIFFPPSASGSPADSVRHVQIVNCLNGIEDAGFRQSNSAYWRTLYVGNVLFARDSGIPGPSTALRGSYLRATLEHLTLDRWSFLAQATGGDTASIVARNSIFANVQRTADCPGVAVRLGTCNGFFASPAFGESAIVVAHDPFVIAAGGRHYLQPGHPWFDQGVIPTDANLARDIKSRTCDPPQIRNQPCALDLVLGPTARRDTDRPDLGYHYTPLDHCWTALKLAGTNGPATLLLTNGAALGIFGRSGLILHGGARFLSQGAPTNLNHIVRHETAQEFPATEPSVGGNAPLFALAVDPPDLPEIRLRFTEVVLLPGQRAWFDNPTGFALRRLAVQDCPVQNARIDLSLYPLQGNPAPLVLALTNNLFRRASLNLSQDTDRDHPRLEVHLRNNLLRGGQLQLADYAGTGRWSVHDNLFEFLTVARAEGVPNSHNGYTGPIPLVGTSGKDIMNVIPDFRTGTLGDTYYPPTGTQLARLIGTGSRSPTAAGLYHYTVKTSNAKEGVEPPLIVDIGFHYVACLSNKPFDTDRDGLPDWLEDANGNSLGTDDPTDWTRADTVGDGTTDLERFERNRNALVTDPAQDYALEQNTQWQPDVAVLDRAVVAVYWDSNRGLYGLASVLTNRCRMVASSISIDGGQTFLDQDAPPLPADAPAGDGGDPVVAVNRVTQTLYFAATSEHGGNAFKGVPLWKSLDSGRSFLPCPLVHEDIASSDYPWLAVDDFPGPGQHDLYLIVSGIHTNTLDTETVRRQWLTVSPGGSATDWSDLVPIGPPNSPTMPLMVVGADHVAYVAWVNRGPTNALQLCAVASRGTRPGPVQTIRLLATRNSPMRLLRSNLATDPEDNFKAFNHAALAINPTPLRSNHLYVAWTDLGTAHGDRADVFFSSSTNGGVHWSPTPVRLHLDDTRNDQWMPSIAVKPDGTQLFVGWLDRRLDPDNGRIDVFGRWATVRPDATVAFAPTDFRITTESFAPAFAGTVPEHTQPGHYDPVWPPGDVNLNWYYPWWPTPEEAPGDLTADSYIHEIGEHNGAAANNTHVFLVWSDCRSGSQATRFPPRRQADIRLVRLPWPQSQ